MNEVSFNIMFSSLEKLLKKDPNNEGLIKLVELLIQKKSEYDIERLKADKEYEIEMVKANKEIRINDQNNFYKYCMTDLFFKSQWDLLSNGYLKNPLPFPPLQLGFN